MKLINDEVTINKIMLDPFNPRFSTSTSTQQNQIQRMLMDDPKTKDLLNSMQTGLTWVNKIVIRKIESYSDNDRNKLGENISEYTYVVVEGNTRLACLKDEKMNGYFDGSKPIPVIEVVKEHTES